MGLPNKNVIYISIKDKETMPKWCYFPSPLIGYTDLILIQMDIFS